MLFKVYADVKEKQKHEACIGNIVFLISAEYDEVWG